jgi:hypothetical protein
MSKKNTISSQNDLGTDQVLVDEIAIKSDDQKQSHTLEEVNDFNEELDPEGNDLNLSFDSTKVLTKTVDAKPKNKTYSTIRLVLIGFAIFLLVIFGALSVGYNLLEFDNPDFDTQMSIDRTIEINPRFPIRPIQPDDKRELKNQINQLRERKFLDRVVGISFEFIIIATFLTLLTYLVYRNTDWPLVKNKYVLVLLIVLATIIIGSGFLLLFQQNNKLPRLIRGHRDSFRERFLPTLPRQL